MPVQSYAIYVYSLKCDYCGSRYSHVEEDHQDELERRARNDGWLVLVSPDAEPNNWEWPRTVICPKCQKKGTDR